MSKRRAPHISAASLRGTPAPWRRFGHTGLEPEAVAQMENACRLPGAVAGALMPDAHVGYGLPIGGVLAVAGAVIPYAVGVDIACRMRLTVLDMPVSSLLGKREALMRTLEKETRFGVGASFEGADRRDHPVLEEDWTVSPITREYRDKAVKQLGTSGGGNHFAEFGELILDRPALGLAQGVYLALLTHSGSRGTGEAVASHYSKVAMASLPHLAHELRHLAWLDMKSGDGGEYWAAMQLMGRYAAANHELIHHRILAGLGAHALAGVENHHNFAWEEKHGNTAVIVHRKGATPAGPGVLGIIPGSMASSGFVVRGKGCPASLHSCSHGAGRRLSRTAALRDIEPDAMRRYLEDQGVTLLSGGLDEAPMAYKDIHAVMAAQTDLVDVLARFEPRLVKMAPPEGRGRKRKKRAKSNR